MKGFWATDYRGTAAAWYADMTDAMRRIKTLGHGARVVRCCDQLIMAVCIQSAELSSGGLLRKTERENVRRVYGDEVAKRYNQASLRLGEMWREVGMNFDAQKSYADHVAQPVLVPEILEFRQFSYGSDAPEPTLADLGRKVECHHPDLRQNYGYTEAEDMLSFNWADAPIELTVGAERICDPVELYL